MATFVNANFWIYFIRTDDDDRVKCKICKKSLKSKRSFNLRQHLKHAHKIEARLERRISKKKKQHENSSLEGKNTGSQTLDSNDSFSRLSTSPTIDIKEECVQEVLVKTYRDSVEQESPFEVNNQENDKNEESSKEDPLTSTINYDKSSAIPDLNNRKNDNKETSTQNPPIPPLYYAQPDNFVEPLAIQRENKRDPLNTFNLPTNNSDEFQPRSKKKKMARSVDDEFATSHRNDNFELWVKKKKQLLEIEELEIRNYKLKLELWEKEQQLHLICSKFTRDIKSSI